MTARLDPTVEKLLLVAVTLQRAARPASSFREALAVVCKKAEIHLHPRVCEQLEKDHGHKP